jgi:hypothetical protein
MVREAWVTNQARPWKFWRSTFFLQPVFIRDCHWGAIFVSSEKAGKSTLAKWGAQHFWQSYWKGLPVEGFIFFRIQGAIVWYVVPFRSRGLSHDRVSAGNQGSIWALHPEFIGVRWQLNEPPEEFFLSRIFLAGSSIDGAIFLMPR